MIYGRSQNIYLDALPFDEALMLVPPQLLLVPGGDKCHQEQLLASSAALLSVTVAPQPDEGNRF